VHKRNTPVFFPAAYAAATLFSTRPGARVPQEQQQQARLLVLAAVLLQPAHVLTDHGHFQYNCISLGLAGLAAAAIARGHDVLGSVLFSLSLNHKQMGLFYAPAFFAHLLGRCLERNGAAAKVSFVARVCTSPEG
jgi:alpha-1,3-glucosyltransferase